MDEYENTPTPSNDSSGVCIAALILGILGMIGGFLPVVRYFTLVCSILAIIFGVKGRKMHNRYSGMATAGLVLGIIGVVFAVLMTVCAGVLGAALCSAASSVLSEI